MRYPNTRLSGCLQLLLLACAVAAAGCGNTDRRYEADYSYELLKKSADGTVTVAEKGQVARATTGDGGGAGGVNTKVRGISKTDVTVEVTLPGNKTVSLKLEPKKTVEEFPAESEYGIRITMSEIRAR
jgi:hypothetical protein